MKTDGTIIVANQWLAEQFGKKASELPGTKSFDLLPEGSLKKQRLGYIAEVIVSGQAKIFKDERSGRFFEHRLFPLKDDHGKVEKLAVFASDITKAVHAQQQMKKSEERFRATFEHAK